MQRVERLALLGDGAAAPRQPLLRPPPRALGDSIRWPRALRLPARPAAGHVAAIIKKFNHSNKVMISSVTGTDNDPQSYILQKQILESAGVLVASSNFDAANIAVKYLNTFV